MDKGKRFKEIVESIKNYGVIVPIVVQKKALSLMNPNNVMEQLNFYVN